MNITFKFIIYLTVSFLCLELPANANNTKSRWFELLDIYSFSSKDHTYCYSGKSDHDFKGGKTIVPASVSKVYSTLFFLKKLGVNHRSQIEISLRDNNLYIKNNSDFYFVSERLFFILTKLNQLGYSNFNNIYINSSFAFNWKLDNPELENYLRSESWSNKIRSEFSVYQQELTKRSLLYSTKKPTIKFNKLIATNNFPVDSLILRVELPPIYKELKSINMYSNNFYHDEKMNSISSMKEFNNFFQTMLNVDESNLNSSPHLDLKVTSRLVNKALRF